MAEKGDCVSMKNLKLLFCSITLLFAALLLLSCGGWESESNDPDKRVMYVSADGKINSLDPIYAADVVSAQMIAAFYDTLLQYDYKERHFARRPLFSA
jgi:ABC-type oligopeptide transport system substrate-binding subunit